MFVIYCEYGYLTHTRYIPIIDFVEAVELNVP